MNKRLKLNKNDVELKNDKGERNFPIIHSQSQQKKKRFEL
jgi:hypothetical protein